MEDKGHSNARRVYVMSYVFGALFGIIGMVTFVAAFIAWIGLLIHFPLTTTIGTLALMGATFGVGLITPELKRRQYESCKKTTEE
jgi:uncharacterized membrane protein YkgB